MKRNRAFKKTMFSILLLSLAWSPATGETPRVWMRLSGNNVLVNALIVSVDSEYCHVDERGRLLRIPIDMVEEIVPLKESSIMDGAALGGGVGLVAGIALTEFVLTDSWPQKFKPEATTLFLAIIGGIIGGVSSSVSGRIDKIHLVQCSREEKREILVRLSQNRVRDRVKQFPDEF